MRNHDRRQVAHLPLAPKEAPGIAALERPRTSVRVPVSNVKHPRRPVLAQRWHEIAHIAPNTRTFIQR